jgi:2-C-methyl-D-erythritol 4-phosphate cytidylyltransferase
VANDKPVAAVVPAAGKGARLGGHMPKAFLKILGKPLFVHTLRALMGAYPFREIVLVVHASQIRRGRELLRRYGLSKVRVVSGGATRAASVKKGLLELSPGVRLVAVHDAARPSVPKEVVRRTLAAAYRGGAAICGIPVSSTVKRVAPRGKYILSTVDRQRLFLAQTPQVFRKNLLLRRYDALKKKAFLATDEAALFDGTRVRVRLVMGDEKNFKVTTKQDLALMKHYFKQAAKNY